MRRLRGLARCGGGAPGAPPIYLGSGAKFSPKIMFPWKVPSIPTHLTLFQNFFSITPPKNSENWNSTEKLLKMVKIFKICNFWAISTCNTSKKRIFHIEFIFKQKKVWFIRKKSKKFKFFQFLFQNLNFFNFFFQNLYWPVGFDCKFFKFAVKIFKTEWLYFLERFWK